MVEHVPYTIFKERYKRWKRDCRKELRERGYTSHWRQFDIWESGAVYWIYDNYLSEANFVTSWVESEWYCE